MPIAQSATWDPEEGNGTLAFERVAAWQLGLGAEIELGRFTRELSGRAVVTSRHLIFGQDLVILGFSPPGPIRSNL